MTIDCGRCTLRPWTENDIAPLPAIANDEEVARYMHTVFPHPYTHDDARAWVARAGTEPNWNLAIEVGGALAGGIGFERYSGDLSGTMHIGYWLGRAFHGRGIATAACAGLSDYIFEHFDVCRIETRVFSPNTASARVLEKCGYLREGIMRRSITKGNVVYDAL